MYASQNGHVEVVDTLLQHEASVDLQNNVRFFAIHIRTCNLTYNSSSFYVHISDVRGMKALGVH